MTPTHDLRFARLRRQVPSTLPYKLAEYFLIAIIAVQIARLIWSAVAPLGPVGNWTSGTRAALTADDSVLTRVDPFFRSATTTGPAVVTNLPIKLFGVRVDQAMGRGSAIIATPDGVQSSFAVGDEIMPGVKLKAVTFEGVTIDRGGIDEQVFLDQSVAAPVVQAGMTAAPTDAPPPPPGAGTALASEIGFVPRLDKGQVNGFIVSPKGSGAAFRAAGLREGDVLTAINGQAIRTPADVTGAMAATSVSGSVMLSIDRGGTAITLSTKVKP